ncbi:hypothetical protein GcM1_083003 [Golovinomyces cichoracearum]|uniref:Uncharacterized protein n=1 Tax=Golovinomyces cichoracearum TaxID=62708 RepID=A0A420JC60_9PEZI|nr:hypothetical protein GcM1_083003 [Golovinomyces cichoracearum]
MGYAGHETIGKLKENCYGIEIDYNIPYPKILECSTCACSKAHEIVSRRKDVEFLAPPRAVFYRVSQDIIQ